MNHAKYLAITGAVLISCSVYAQKKQFTMAEATNGMATTLAPKGIKDASWEPGTNKLYFMANDAWVSMHFPDKRVDTVMRLAEFNKAANKNSKKLPSFKWISKDEVYYQEGDDIYRGMHVKVGFMWEHWNTLPGNADNVTVDKSKNIAYTIDNNLYMVTADKKTFAVTNARNKNIISGHSVHREEFGINGGIFFSPEGNYLAYYYMDQTMVKDYPVMHWMDIPATDSLIKYPMAGGTSHQVQVRVFNPRTDKSVTLNISGPKDQYLTCVSWSPDERYVFVAVLNRDQDHLSLNKYSAETGAFISTLFEEKSKKYVEPQHPLTFLKGSKDQFLWWSQRDGYMHLYLYNTEGKLIRQVTKGNWVVNDILGMNPEKQEVLIAAAKESPMEKHSYTVNWNTGKMHRIDAEPGVHSAMPNENGDYVYDVFSAAGVPKRTQVLSASGNFNHVMLEAANPLYDYDRPEIKPVTLYAEDGTPLYGKLILPTNFNTKKKYPVIVYLYNGPHVQLIKNTFPESGNLWYEYMAQHGYAVFTMDGRGSGNRGLKFENATFGKLGTVEMEDQLRGVAYLKSLPYVDSNRMGVHGWSFGGFMTTSLMLRHPGVFKCAVAGGPVMDWKMYEVMYTERYMNTPEQNPQGYADACLFDKVKNLKGKLLLIHGTDDITVVWQQSVLFLKKAIDANVQLDYFIYPGYEHNVRGKDRVHLMQKITDYFDTYLK
ncbi:MAG: S9 family peptidase [Bacteroidetes bacterium 43-93]|nr:DPP IV N-terminal domain-containing protein [Bacteroidota bacterium]OJW95574.1 MAG: S9 family peptidase [Bacteroidetes bacterium 43-93]